MAATKAAAISGSVNAPALGCGGHVLAALDVAELRLDARIARHDSDRAHERRVALERQSRPIRHDGTEPTFERGGNQLTIGRMVELDAGRHAGFARDGEESHSEQPAVSARERRIAEEQDHGVVSSLGGADDSERRRHVVAGECADGRPGRAALLEQLAEGRQHAAYSPSTSATMSASRRSSPTFPGTTR